MKHIPIFAHRGASGYALENTLKAFEKAKALGADGIEIDLQISKDAIFVVFHDLDLKRLVGIRKLVSDCTAEELMKYNLGSRWERIFQRQRMMSFQQLIQWATKEKMALNIELKESILENHDVLRQTMRTIELPENSHISSFHTSLLKTVKEVRPDIETAILVTKKFDWHNVSKQNCFDVIHAHKKYYKPQYLNCCDEAKIGIRFYGIKGNESYLANPHPAVLGWITDYPDKVRKAQKYKVDFNRGV
ncbi:MAG: glycerophosphodiester phosphodiesterase family protein [Solibacillus sp.]|jgi:glycerophosphoryl diester phosphodiesterase|uniref:glycerophosphodiester phosphodiesterase n=1 Tax=unclassified Solibacillus TaxID=2637870 RepID=UPI0030F52286